MLSCQRCKQASNGPQAFLLTCQGCHKTWHHRCHMPPVDDGELIRRIRATNAGDTTSGNDLSAWTCRRCRKKGVSESGTPSTAVSSREPTASSESREDSDRKNLTSRPTATPSAKQESNAEIDAGLVDDRERNDKSDRQEATEAAPVTRKRQPVARKTAKPSAPIQLHVQERNEESDGHEVTETAPTVKRTLIATKRAKPPAPVQLHVQERNEESDGYEATEAAPTVKRALIATKRAKPPAASRPHVQPQPYPTQPRNADVRMADTTPTKFTPQEKKKSPQSSFSQIPSHQDTGARRSVSTVSTTSPEDDVEMQVDVSPPTFSKSTSRATSRASQATPSGYQAISTGSVAEAPLPVRAATSTTSEQEGGTGIQPLVNQDTENEVDDDPEDLYGPPVERRIIRILPSLAEELREQQRRTAAEKEKRRAPLAPDWIFAKHVHDPSWKEIPTRTEGRRKRKSAAVRLGDNGLNTDELLGCFTVRKWVRGDST